MQKVKSKKPTATAVKPVEKKLEAGQHLKVPLDAKHLLKMHISHAIMQHLGMNK